MERLRPRMPEGICWVKLNSRTVRYNLDALELWAECQGSPDVWAAAVEELRAQRAARVGVL
ncbi:hypothetical protein [Gloeobacter violaceus]|nr:hypothetical protein [Gloeobacter violaceus]